jgi:hypothetical protein
VIQDASFITSDPGHAKSLTRDKMLRFRYGLSRNDHHEPI